MKLDRVNYDGPALYEIVDSETGLKYIGSTGNMRQRAKQHLTALKNNCHKNGSLNELYNKTNGELILVVHEEDSKEEAIKHENELLDYYQNSDIIVNINKSNYKHAEETKAKISKTLLGFKRSEENRANMSKSRIGKELSEEHKRNISMGKGIPVTVDGVEYRNMNIAARALNVPPSRIPKLANGEVVKPPKRKVEINGNIYESLVEARNNLNLTKRQLERRLNSSSEQYKDFKRL